MCSPVLVTADSTAPVCLLMIFFVAADVVVLLMLSIRLRPIERFAFVQRDENANRTAADRETEKRAIWCN